MKMEYAQCPPSMENMTTYGFSWMDFVTAIPSPLLVVTSYKANGQPNATLQSWATFCGSEQGFYAILSSVNAHKHLYQTLKAHGEAVLNFPSSAIYDQCLATIRNNGDDDDEITQSGLTVEAATVIHAPCIAECFLQLECCYLWEKEIVPGNEQLLICLEVVNIRADEAHLDEETLGRYGETGFLYNIHYPINPENFPGTSHDWIAVLSKHRDMGEY